MATAGDDNAPLLDETGAAGRLGDGDDGGAAGATSAAEKRTWAQCALSAFRKPATADLSVAKVHAYGVGAFTLSIIIDLPSFYSQAYLLENVGLPATSVGNLLLAAKIFDAFVDPMIGAGSDATRSRLGRRRPWMLTALPIAVLFNVLFWTVWPDMVGNEAASFAYYLIAICILTASCSVYYIPFTALPVTVCAKDLDRVRLSTSRTTYMIVGDMVAVGVLTLTSLIFADDSSRSYQVAAAINAVIIATVILVSVFGVPEPSSDKPVRASRQMPRKSFRRELKQFFIGIGALARSWQYMSLTLMSTMGWLSIYFVQNNLYLFAKYAVLRPDLFDPILLLALASCAVFVPVWAALLSYLSKRKVMAIGIVWLVLTWVLVTIIPQDNVPFISVVAILSGGGISVANLMPWVFLSDVIDDDELTHGHRREGLLSAFFVFVNKVSIGLSLAISGYILSAGGYDNSDGEPEPSDQLARTMRLLCGILPIVCAACMVPLLYLNPMTYARQVEINRRIVELRRSGGEKAAAAQREISPLLPPLETVASSAEVLPSASDLSFGRGNLPL